MIRPPSRRCLAASCVATNNPRTLMAISFSKSSSENCSMGAKMPVPALFTRISMAPNVPMVLATASRTASVSAASALIASAFPPVASIERTTSLALPGDALYVRATPAPSVASRVAIAAPMLREPPVTSATLPASFLVMFVFIIFSFCSASVSCQLGRVVHLLNHLPLPFDLAQYRIPCAAMLFRHDGTPQLEQHVGLGFGRDSGY